VSALLLALALHASPTWDGRSPVQVTVGDSVTLEVPQVRFVSVGGGDVVDVTVSRQLTQIHLRGLRRGTRTVMAHFKDGRRAPLQLSVVPRGR
jgi:hypothetical protein